MSTLNALAVRDRQLDAFHRPFFVLTIGLGVRSFADECARPESEFKKHPEDYELYHIGFYEEETGELRSQKPKQIALATQYVTP